VVIERAQWRLYLDRFVVLVIVIALWQACSVYFGTIWFSGPWLVFTRFADELASGDLLFNAEYTLKAALYGALLGGIPGALLPFALRRHPRSLVSDGTLSPPHSRGNRGSLSSSKTEGGRLW